MTTQDEARNFYAPQRQDYIVARAREAGRVDVVALADFLGVTPETVRRDLTSLEQRGLVRRVHGGALPVEPVEPEPTILQRLGRGQEQKARIAQRALAELPERGTVLLDAGTTTLAIAHAWPNNSQLTVVTNSVPIAALLLQRGHEDLHVIGGRIRDRTSATVGSWATGALHDVVIDLCLLGTNGFTLEFGMTTPDAAEAEVKRAMVAASRRRIVVADSTKAGHSHFHRFATVSDISLLITDTGLDDETAESLDAAGMEVSRT